MTYQEKKISRRAYEVLEKAGHVAEISLNPYVTPEHVLSQMEAEGMFGETMVKQGLSPNYFRERLALFFSFLPQRRVPHHVKLSPSLTDALEYAIVTSNGDTVDTRQLLQGIATLNGSLAAYLLRKHSELWGSLSTRHE